MREQRIINDLTSLPEEQWQMLNTGNNPFLSYAFLSGLERFDCLKNQYWQPTHIIIEEDGQLLGVLPLYIKQDSYGEFVFDWAWADAYQRAGRAYYPKLVSAVPFTPVTGSRLLIKKSLNENDIRNELIQAALGLMEEYQFSSWHVLFPHNEDLSILMAHSGMERLTCQYHWFNQGYRDFKDFTDSLTSKKRKKIKKERRNIHESGIEIERLSGKDIKSEHWEIFYRFYCATFYKKWGEPRFTRDFFQFLGKTLPEQSLLILAKQDDEYIAGAFAMNDQNTLYGRHWGCSKQLPFLHFELCYYQTIEHTIAKGLKKLDAGVQGEHKMARGFEPIAMPSSHWVRETDFRSAISKYLHRESIMMKEHIAMLKKHLPYKTH